MKLVKRSRVAVTGLLLIVFVLAGVAADYASQGKFSFQGSAFAASKANDEEDPFAKKTKAVPDPLESFNRAMFTLNDRLYFWFWKPLATIYAAYIPCGVRMCIRNAFDNAKMPVRVVNNLLQCKPDRAGSEVKRFVINSTLGMGGFFDVAHTHFNVREYDEDFGQTLAVWGVDHRFYITLPILGASSLRDGFGLIFDAFLNPIYYVAPDFGVAAGIRGGEGVNSTSLRMGEYEDFKKSAVDPYVSMRDAYIQYRADEAKR